MTKKLKALLAALVLAPASLSTGCSNVRTIGRVNGVELTRVTTRGVFSPATTTILAHSPKWSGEIHARFEKAADFKIQQAVS